MPGFPSASLRHAHANSDTVTEQGAVLARHADALVTTPPTGFLGSSIRQSYLYPNELSEQAGSLAPVIYLVDNGVESTNNYFSVDISDSAIHIGFLTASGFGSLGSFSGPQFADYGSTLPDIIGVTLVTTMPGLDIGDISWNADAIMINWIGLPFNPAYSATLNVTFAPPPDHVSFTAGNDGSAAHPIDFNQFAGSAHLFDGQRNSAQSGDDFVVLPNLASINAHNPWSYNGTFNAGPGDDVIQGGDGNDIVSGDSGRDWLYGGAGNDRLSGAGGDDIVSGGAGADMLSGGGGRDIFLLTDSEIGTSRLAGQHDMITDFRSGLDKLDISELFSDHAFGGLHDGQLGGTAADAWQAGLYRLGGSTWIEGDTNGDGKADFVVELGSAKLVAGDLITDHVGFAAAAGPTMFEYAAMHVDQILPHA